MAQIRQIATVAYVVIIADVKPLFIDAQPVWYADLLSTIIHHHNPLVHDDSFTYICMQNTQDKQLINKEAPHQNQIIA